MTDSPLQGLHIINTRPRHQAAAWSQKIQAMGATVSDIPAIEIEATHPKWLPTVLPLEQFKQIIFVSANAVDYFFSTIPNPSMISDAIQISAVGEQTANRLTGFSINPYFPTVADSEHLLQMKHLQKVNNQTILIVKGVGGRRLISKSLASRGAKIKQVSVYRRCCPKPPNNLDNLWKDRKEKIILVTSKVAIDNLFRMMPNFQLQLQQATWLVLSKRIADYARKKEVKHIIISNGKQLITTLKQHKQGLAHD